MSDIFGVIGGVVGGVFGGPVGAMIGSEVGSEVGGLLENGNNNNGCQGGQNFGDYCQPQHHHHHHHHENGGFGAAERQFGAAERDFARADQDFDRGNYRGAAAWDSLGNQHLAEGERDLGGGGFYL